MIALDLLECQDERKILFIFDTEGGKGKSFFANYLLATQNAIIFENGKSADIK